MDEARAIGIDVGGTSVKGALVGTESGRLLAHRRRRTPAPPTVSSVVELIGELVEELATDAPAAPVGVGLSSDVLDGRHTSGVSLDPSWIGAPALDLIEARLGRSCVVANDADVAALAEARLGAARDIPGVVVMLTFGTGIGSGIIADGRLVPNSGLGQLRLGGRPAELTLSAVARERSGMTWAAWAAAVSAFLAEIDELLRPRRFVIGGGVVGSWEHVAPLLDVAVPVVPAAFGPEAGVVGAAVLAAGGESHRA